MIFTTPKPPVPVAPNPTLGIFALPLLIPFVGLVFGELLEKISTLSITLCKIFKSGVSSDVNSFILFVRNNQNVNGARPYSFVPLLSSSITFALILSLPYFSLLFIAL